MKLGFELEDLRLEVGDFSVEAVYESILAV